MTTPSYIGRFAPSPSGPLHFGSLVAALASYLDAHSNQGHWLVRMEDIDPPREQQRAAAHILKTLEAYGLQWHGSVLFQSERSGAYQTILDKLLTKRQLYPCTCTRKKLAGTNGIYPGYCRNNTVLPNEPFSLRLKCPDETFAFNDSIQGFTSFGTGILDDFILKRKDGLFAYQLAVCVDDEFQKITHIVRGFDLIDSTPRQLHLQNVLGYQHPIYSHIPVISLSDGNKLSKQNHAPAIPLDEPRPLLVKAMKALAMIPPADLVSSSLDDIIQWGIRHWDMNRIPSTSEIPLKSL
ncbi:tRNA glutamyl-Q(34) synthetase GluQRS [Endozoicomonas sp. (ex Bugula neritina AB1)]|nr:tRNA glutamyl-Q(34) synthetase GluQRS [Endozoicomonas sp. (ex Bugula neritina AB1)]